MQTEDYKNIKQQVLVMLGDRDKMVSVEETLAVFKALSNGYIAMLPGTPHPIEQVKTGMLQYLIDNHLKK